MWTRFKPALKNPSFMIGFVIVTLITLAAVFANLLTVYPIDQMDMANRFSGPTLAHPLGTDNFGRDLWTAMALGGRISLSIAYSSVLASMVVGSVIGITAGFFGGWIDNVLMRITDAFLSLPVIVLALALIAVLGPGAVNVIIALTAIFWTEYARVLRATTISLRSRPYVDAARTLGASNLRILWREILPNSLSPILVLATLGFGNALITESALSFLGFGVAPPTPTWGRTLSYGTQYLRDAPWMSTVAGLAIMLTVLGFNLMGDGLRDLNDTRRSPLTRRELRRLRKRGKAAAAAEAEAQEGARNV